jgi:hypothetical protein
MKLFFEEDVQAYGNSTKFIKKKSGRIKLSRSLKKYSFSRQDVSQTLGSMSAEIILLLSGTHFLIFCSFKKWDKFHFERLSSLQN